MREVKEGEKEPDLERDKREGNKEGKGREGG